MDQQLLELYSDYLIASFGQTTATGLSALLSGAISHDRITRFLGNRSFTSKDLWHLVKPLVRQVESEDAVLIIDDTVEEKPYTDESELICWHYDHSQGKTVKGVNLLSALYHSRKTSLPVGFELILKSEWVVDEKTGKPKRQAKVTKQELYRQLVKAAVVNLTKLAYVLNDVWFASAENMVFVKEECRREFVMPLKENRKVAMSQQEQKAKQFVIVSTLSLEEGATRQVWLEGVPFPLLLTRQVFKNEDGSEGTLYLVSSDTALSAQQMSEIYQRRWKVEEYHQTLKSHLAFAKSPAQRTTSLGNHLFCCLYAFTKLETLRLKTTLHHVALRTKLYQAALATAFEQLQQLKRSAPISLAPA